MNIIKLSIIRPTVVVVTFAILVFFGLFSYSNLNQELFPKINSSAIAVSTVYSGAGPFEVENSVTKKIEDAVSSLEGVENISSISMETFSVVTIQLKVEVDVDIALQNAQRKINAIRSDLPDNVEEPSLSNFDLNDIPIMTIGSTAQMDETAFYDLIDKEVKPMLERIQGVARVNLIGGQEREIQININEERMSAYGLSIVDVSNTLVALNLDFPAGKVKNDNEQVLIRLQGKFHNMTEIENTVLKYSADRTVVKVRDIAEVSDTYKEAVTINRVNGVPSIGITIQRSSDANSVEVSNAVLALLEQAKEHNKNRELDFVVAANSSGFTLEASRSVMKDLVIAIILVAFTMLLFLHSFRDAVIVSIAIPASLISTFIFMYLFGFSLNLMSLLALTLAVGILVDDAIVVIENIHRHLEMGKSSVQAAYDGIREIGPTIVSITLVLVVVFIPVSLTQGVISDLFRQFALTIAIATLFSLLVSFSIVPLLSSRFGKLEKLNPDRWIGKVVYGFENGISRVGKNFSILLNWSFSHKLLVFGITFLALAGSVSLLGFGFIGAEFASQGDQGQFIIDIELPRDATVEQTNAITLQAEGIIMSSPLVKTVFTTVGAEENGQPQARLAEIRIKMVSYNQRTTSDMDLAREVKFTLQKNIPGARFTTATSGLMGDVDDDPIQYYVTGNDIDPVISAANRIYEAFYSVKGVIDPKLSVEEGNPEISITPDREKMASLGISPDGLGFALYNAFSGNTDAKYREGNNEYNMTIRLDPSGRKNVTDIKNFSLPNASGEVIKLSQFAQIEEVEGPTKLERRNRAPSVTVSCQAGGRPVGDIGADIDNVIAELNLPETITISYGGDLENQDESFGTLGMALIISILLVYLIMVLLYNSYVYPFVVLFSIPLAIIGAFLALSLTMESLNVFTILGLLMLIGLVAKNAILVVDFTNQMKAGGMELKAALLEATHKRFRPIIMTTLATIIGMLPIALAGGAGAEWKNGLAWVVIGGLISSMFLTLIIVPLVYYITDKLRARFGFDRKIQIEIKD
ncbi:MAG: efflux RND transporter permease subunit [Tannerellaceae bacterium]|jgi:HAE1 family hydrophobic/amphiphilic exporter-1|nr:efflux RND transporter permease subunit [Tannerellaceae bacterium]